jgi:alpha-N-arabinofuranosidase
MMRRVDPGIVLSAAALPDLDWTLALLRAAGKYLDLVSIHDYWDPLWQKDEPKDYVAAILECEKPDKLIAATRQVLGVSGFADSIGIAFDEWNLRGWHHPAGNSPEALEARNRNDIAATYTMADALFSASFLNACLRNADIVRMANISPTVNTRGPLFVHDGGIVRRTSFHALKMYVDQLLPRLADCFIQSDRIVSGETSVAAFDAVASCEGSGGELRLMLLNRDPTRPLSLRLKVDGQPISGAFDSLSLSGDSPDAFNSVESPERVTPQKAHVDIDNGIVTLPPHTLMYVRLG